MRNIILVVCVGVLFGTTGMALAQLYPYETWEQQRAADNQAQTLRDQWQADMQRSEQRLEMQRQADQQQQYFQQQADQRRAEQRQDEQRYEQQQEMRRWAAPHREESRSYLLPR